MNYPLNSPKSRRKSKHHPCPSPTVGLKLNVTCFLCVLQIDTETNYTIATMQDKQAMFGSDFPKDGLIVSQDLTVGWRGGSIGMVVSDSRSELEDPKFEPSQEHKKNLWEFYWVKNVLTHCRCSWTPVCILYSTHKNDHVRKLKIFTVVHVKSLMD